MNSLEYASRGENLFEYEEATESVSEFENPFTQEEEIEMAYELLEISTEEELDYFLGKLFKRAWRGIKRFGSKVGHVLKPLGGVLKGVAKKLLPIAAGAAGTFFGGPGGGALGAKLGSMVSSALEMELDGFASEDREFEVARRFVRMAGAAARQAALSAPAMNASSAAQQAVIAALKHHVPNLANSPGVRTPDINFAFNRSGHWIRRGNRIIVTEL